MAHGSIGGPAIWRRAPLSRRDALRPGRHHARLAALTGHCAHEEAKPGWASAYHLLAILVAAGIVYPRVGIMLRPEWSALPMRVSSIFVAVNAVLLKGVERDLG